MAFYLLARFVLARLVIILRVKVKHFVGISAKRQPPVASDVRAPGAFAITRGPMNFPQRPGWKALYLALLIKPPKRLMTETPDFHF